MKHLRLPVIALFTLVASSTFAQIAPFQTDYKDTPVSRSFRFKTTYWNVGAVAQTQVILSDLECSSEPAQVSFKVSAQSICEKFDARMGVTKENVNQKWDISESFCTKTGTTPRLIRVDLSRNPNPTQRELQALIEQAVLQQFVEEKVEKGTGFNFNTFAAKLFESVMPGVSDNFVEQVTEMAKEEIARKIALYASDLYVTGKFVEVQPGEAKPTQLP